MPPETSPQSNQPFIADIVSALTDANNVLVTVSKDPTLDQLAACIGLTLGLNKKDKHATAVFSGEVPSVIDFLEPDKTLEKTTDSLRDFIISLDKAKADKLRYKVEDDVVRIFITPYKTSITSDDLEFSQGDFNVDAVVALGVHSRNDLDAAIVAHGRILHDATIISLNTTETSDLGSINWNHAQSSSLSEMVSDLLKNLDESVLDSQIATALLTGIVSETDRFRNEKVTPHTMSVSGVLMSAGASTQLVSSQLEKPEEKPVDEETAPSEEVEDHEEISQVEASTDEPEPKEEPKPEPPKKDDGVIQIDHDSNDIHIDDTGRLAKMSEIIDQARHVGEEEGANVQASAPEPVQSPTTEPALDLPEPAMPTADAPDQAVTSGPSMIYEPPTFGGQLTANTQKVDQMYDSTPDPLTAQHHDGYTLNREPNIADPAEPQTKGREIKPLNDQTLSELEKSVGSPHVTGYQETPVADVYVPPTPVAPMDVPATGLQPDYARDAVERAVQGSTDYRPEPIQALGAAPVGLDLGHGANSMPAPAPQVSQGPPPPPVPPPLPPMS